MPRVCVTKDTGVRPASLGRSTFAPCPRGPAAGLEPGFPESRTPAASPACATGRLCRARPASGAVGQFSSVPHPRRGPGSDTRTRMSADGAFRAAGARRLDRGALGRLLSPALAPGQVDRIAGSEPGRRPVHPVDVARFGPGYGACPRAVDAGAPVTKAPGGVPVTGAPPSDRCPWVSPLSLQPGPA